MKNQVYKLIVLFFLVFSTLRVNSQTVCLANTELSYLDPTSYTGGYYDHIKMITVAENTPIKITYSNNTLNRLIIYTNSTISSPNVSTNQIVNNATVTVTTADGKIFIKSVDEGDYFEFYDYFCLYTLNYAPDNSYTVNDNLYARSNSIILGKLGVGVENPVKRVEIWDGTSGRFTFSGANVTSGYEVAQTMNNTGYKLNIISETKDYRIAVNGIDKFKLLRYNYAIGLNAMNLITTGTENTAIGNSALKNTSSGSNNIAIGYESLLQNTTGGLNAAIGLYTLRSNTGGAGNFAVGQAALYSNSTGSDNVGIGYYAFSKNIAGSNNIAIGNRAGEKNSDLSNNSSSASSLFIGGQTKSAADNQTNQIVIGYGAIGNGSNTVTLGNNDIAKTILKGKVGIGITNISTDALLTVNGIIHAKEIKVSLDNLADYVFSPEYKLMPLFEVERFVKNNHHLPEIPSAADVKENGLSMGEMQNKLLQKIEELTLYVIEQQKQIDAQNKIIKEILQINK